MKWFPKSGPQRWQVLKCASPLALPSSEAQKSGRGLPYSKTQRALRSGVALAMSVGLLIALGPRQRGSQRASLQPAELLRAELIVQDGRLHRAGDTNTFSGVMIERRNDGALQSRSAVFDGWLDGLSEGWFTNGQLQVTEHFKRGVSHGLRTKWFPSGKKLSEGNIVDGKFQGTFRKWHENGVLAEQVEFIDGQPAGVSLAYFPSGAVKARARLESGKIIEQRFWKDGESDESSLSRERPDPSSTQEPSTQVEDTFAARRSRNPGARALARFNVSGPKPLEIPDALLEKR
jgi:antitoxin component YwqK of YwqJK toxin-antitoxin module